MDYLHRKFMALMMATSNKKVVNLFDKCSNDNEMGYIYKNGKEHIEPNSFISHFITLDPNSQYRLKRTLSKNKFQNAYMFQNHLPQKK